MRRVISVHLPYLQTDRLRLISTLYPRDRPLVTVAKGGSKRIIAAVDACATRLGLRAGQTHGYAQALIPELMHVDTNAPADTASLEQTALWCLKRYSPIVALDAPDGLWLDVTGCAHLFGGEQALLADLHQHLRQAGFTARMAMAETAGAAHAMARFGHQPRAILETGKLRQAMGPLPVQALRIGDAMATRLNQLGFIQIGQLYDAPRGPLAKRIGPELLQRFDQVTGFAAEPLVPVELPELLMVKRNFAEPVTNPEYLAKVTGGLAEELCRQLDEAGMGARQVNIHARRVDNMRQAVRINTSSPSHDARHLTRMLCEKLPGIDAGFGIEVLALTASIVEPFHHKQISTAFAAQAAPELDALVDVLCNRVGPRRVYKVLPVQSDVPERSVRRSLPTQTSEFQLRPTALPRPSLLLRVPESVEAMGLLPDHAPTFFIWRQKRHRIVRADGPERIYGEWWKDAAEREAVRDYFRVEDEHGKRYWLFRRGDGESLRTGSHKWYLHGVFG